MMTTEDAPVPEPTTMLSVFSLLMAPLLPCEPDGERDRDADDDRGGRADD